MFRNLFIVKLDILLIIMFQMGILFLVKQSRAPERRHQRIVKRLSNSLNLRQYVFKVDSQDEVHKEINNQPHECIRNFEIIVRIVTVIKLKADTI